MPPTCFHSKHPPRANLGWGWSLPHWAWGVGRYGRLGDRGGHWFLTLFLHSFLGFHFLVLVPQFYPRCNVSRRERQRESEAAQTDEMDTHPPRLVQSQQKITRQEIKRDLHSGEGLKIKRSSAFLPTDEIKTPHF